MNKELLLLYIKPTDTLIEQTKTKAQGTLELKLNKQLETFCFSPPINLIEQRKWLVTKTTFEATNCVFTMTDVETIVFKLIHQVIGLPVEVQKPITSHNAY